VSALLLGSAACGGDSGSSSEAPGNIAPDAEEALATLSGVSAEGAVGEDLSVTLESPIESDEAQSAILTEGDGNPLQTNDAALIHLYVGNGTSGKQAANTYEAGPPVQVTATEGQLFQVILDAPEGTEVEPSEEAPALVEEDGQITGFDWTQAPKKAPTELTVIPLVEGDGPEARAESMVTFDYLGAVYGKDKPFDESFSADPVPFGVGVKGLIPAWDKVIPGLTLGSRVLIIAPPEDAYGDADQPGIPANSTLAFVVDVLGVDE
jgi:peptidylprolyl isomerase